MLQRPPPKKVCPHLEWFVSDTAGSLSDLTSRLLHGVEVEGPYDDENGRFGWGVDPEGNRFELWQPPPGR